jgi:hypothetical protein
LVEQVEHLIGLLAVECRSLVVFFSNLHWVAVCHSICRLQRLITQKVATVSADESEVQDGSQNAHVGMTAHLLAGRDCVDLTLSVSLEPVMQLSFFPTELQSDSEVVACGDFVFDNLLGASNRHGADQQLQLWHDLRVGSFERADDIVVEAVRRIERSQPDEVEERAEVLKQTLA